MKLNESQKKTVQNSLWIIHTVLKELNVKGNADLKQIGWLALCKAVLKFDKNKGTQWNTYAYTCVYRLVCREINYSYRTHKTEVSIENFYSIQEEQLDNEQQIENKVRVKNLLSSCSEKEKTILQLLMQGYTQKDIGNKIGLCAGSIKKIIKRIRERTPPC